MYGVTPPYSVSDEYPGLSTCALGSAFVSVLCLSRCCATNNTVFIDFFQHS